MIQTRFKEDVRQKHRQRFSCVCTMHIKSRSWRPVLWILIFLAASCSPESEPQKQNLQEGKAVPEWTSVPPTPGETLPDDLEWLTNHEDPIFASPQARKGGTLHLPIDSFPMTFRTVGPDSNRRFRENILGNQLSLVSLHPNTLKIIPELATHWAYGKDKKTMYFKLDPRARWSDGVPVTAGDFAYTLEFMRSEYIVAPWYNDYYTEEIERVIIYDDHTLAVVGAKAQPDLQLKLTIGPTPRHFYGKLDENFVRKYNWSIVPNTGPYQIDKFQKGRYVRFKRKKDWWANDLYYFRNRFNVDTVLFKVIRDENLTFEYFRKAQMDAFLATLPAYWHIKTNTPEVEKGYIHKIWFF
ncbi:MAG: ABC transporter substrate-binding protein, partial [Acidobacteriota bacterium]